MYWEEVGSGLVAAIDTADCCCLPAVQYTHMHSVLAGACRITMGICPKQHKAPDWCSNSLTSLVTPGKHSAQLWQSPTDTHVTGAVPFSVLDIGCVGLVRVALWTDDGWPWLVVGVYSPARTTPFQFCCCHSFCSSSTLVVSEMWASKYWK